METSGGQSSPVRTSGPLAPRATGSVRVPRRRGLGSNGVKNACAWPTAQTDCLPNEYCDAPDCTKPGSCVERPSPLKSGNQGWACGCDGVTYWNVTFARAQGVTAPTQGQCSGPSSGGVVTPADPLACSNTNVCPRGAVCLPAATSSCTGTAAQGYCWAWPDDFACSTTGTIGYLACSGTTKCMTECEAITNRSRYRMTTVGCR